MVQRTASKEVKGEDNRTFALLVYLGSGFDPSSPYYRKLTVRFPKREQASERNCTNFAGVSRTGGFQK